MNSELQDWLKAAFECISCLQSDYSTNKALILAEGDLECLLFSKLNSHPLFNRFEETKTEGWKSGYVHSQVCWFMQEKDSGFFVDLTILNPQNLSIDRLERVEEYPNKGFFHDGMAIAIEVKFIRDRSSVRKYAKQDYDKIVNNLRIAKEQLIDNARYLHVAKNDIAYISLIVCKTKDIFSDAINTLRNTMREAVCPDNVFPIVFSHERISFLNTTLTH